MIAYLMLVYGTSIGECNLKVLIADQMARLEHTSDLSGYVIL